jgi:hypothetical protein
MNHLTEEELILHYYGDHDSAAAHLDECEPCRREYHALQRTLNAVDCLPVPERSPDYEAEVWRALASRLPQRKAPSAWRLIPKAAPKWAMAAAVLIAAFLAGRYAEQHPPESSRSANPEKILLVAVGDHLERSQIVLAELANSAPDAAGLRGGNQDQNIIDISYERDAAEDLVESNRLFRQSALIAGDKATAAILDDLERTLIEIAHSPRQLSARQFEELRAAIKDRGLQFKVRVFQTQIPEREKAI